jgi:hypothetical protein
MVKTYRRFSQFSGEKKKEKVIGFLKGTDRGWGGNLTLLGR